MIILLNRQRVALILGGILLVLLAAIFLWRPWRRQTVFLKKKITIIIDAGHGGMDTGASYGNLREKDLNLEIAQYLKEYLEEEKYTVIMTRTEDVLFNNHRRQDLERRVKIAEDNKADLFLSIHVNKYPSAQPFGGEAFYHPKSEAGKILAHCIQKELLKLQPDSYRSIKSGDFFVLRETTMPGVIIEVAFLSNAQDRLRLQNKEEKKEIARAITRGVKRYFSKNYNGLDITGGGRKAPYGTEVLLGKEGFIPLYFITQGGQTPLVKLQHPVDYYQVMAELPGGSLQEKLINLALQTLVENATPYVSPLPPSTVYRCRLLNGNLLVYLSFNQDDYYSGSTIELLAYEALEKTLSSFSLVKNVVIINEDDDWQGLGHHIMIR